MNGSHNMTVELVSGVLEEVAKMSGGSAPKYDVLVCPPAPYLSLAVATADASSVGAALKVGAQNMSPYDEGAYTGEVSLPMLTELGCRYVLLGHSERRVLFGENDKACLLYTSPSPRDS